MDRHWSLICSCQFYLWKDNIYKQPKVIGRQKDAYIVGMCSPDTVASTSARICAWKAALSRMATDTMVGCAQALLAVGSCRSSAAEMKAAKLEAVG